MAQEKSRIFAAGFMVDAFSQAGVATSVFVQSRPPLPKLSVLFDVGHITPQSLSASHVFVSHSHLDHIGGLTQHARAAACSQHQPTYFVPHEIQEQVAQFQAACEALDGCEAAPMNIQYMREGMSVALGKGYRAEFVRMQHRVPSYGIVITLTVNKGLKEEFRNLGRDDLAKLAKQGVKLSNTVDEVVLAYTGDTTFAGVEAHLEKFGNAKLLISEMTFLDEESLERSVSTQHIHLNEFVRRCDAFHNECVIFIHMSARYSAHQILQLAKNTIPSSFHKNCCFALAAFGIEDSQSAWAVCSAQQVSLASDSSVKAMVTWVQNRANGRAVANRLAALSGESNAGIALFQGKNVEVFFSDSVAASLRNVFCSFFAALADDAPIVSSSSTTTLTTSCPGAVGTPAHLTVDSASKSASHAGKSDSHTTKPAEAEKEPAKTSKSGKGSRKGIDSKSKASPAASHERTDADSNGFDTNADAMCEMDAVNSASLVYSPADLTDF